VSLEKLQGLPDGVPLIAAANPHDWPLMYGSLNRAARASGSPPLLDLVRWRRPIIIERDDETGKDDMKNGGPSSAPGFIDRAIERQAANFNGPVISGFPPIAVGGKLIYRTYGRISAIYLTDYKDPAGKFDAKAGDVYWHSTDLDGALTTVLDDPTVRPTLETWLNYFAAQQNYLNLVF